MSVREAEKDASDVLRVWWNENDALQTLPIDPEAIAESLGIDVERGFLPSDQSGMIDIPVLGRPTITLNMFDHHNRQRFTCAHELGHYIQRGKRGVKKRHFVDYRATLAGIGRDPGEIYANQFAAALLMPARLVERYVNRGDEVGTMAARFVTSEQAMSLRLRNLNLA